MVIICNFFYFGDLETDFYQKCHVQYSPDRSARAAIKKKNNFVNKKFRLLCQVFETIYTSELKVFCACMMAVSITLQNKI
jgi:hypothetical protein